MIHPTDPSFAAYKLAQILAKPQGELEEGKNRKKCLLVYPGLYFEEKIRSYAFG